MPGLLALLAFLLHLPFAGRYGFFRDELYFIACGQHLDWGYVDQPPLIALVTRVATALTGTSLFGFRLWSALAAAALVALVAVSVRALGGGRFAQVVAAIATFFAPFLLAGGHLVTMNAFEPVFWTAAAYLVARLLQTEEPRRWLGVGLIVGVGLLNKHSMAFFAAALVVGVAISSGRRLLWTRWFAGAVAVAALVVLPHVIWQQRHGWPMLELLENGRRAKNAPFSLGAFLGGAFQGVHPVFALVWGAGLWTLLRDRRLRALAAAWIAVGAILIAGHGKDYYFAPAFPMLFAAGAVAWERWLARVWARVAFAAGLASVGAAIAPLVVPLLPPEGVVAYQRRLGFSPPHGERMTYRDLPQHLADQFGWPELARTVSDVYLALPEAERRDAVVLARNYGEAGALDLYARELPMPRVISGHNSYYLWGPGPAARPVVIVLNRTVEDVKKACADARLAATTPPNPWVLPYEDEIPVVVCRGLRVDLDALWPELKNYI